MPIAAPPEQEIAPVWAIVELMGHVRLAGRLSEEEKFGAKMGRLDIPAGQACSAVSAGWCPIHGDCVCKDPDDKNDEACPLHSPSSTHGDVQDERFVTQFFGGGSVYRITIVSEHVARHAAKSARHEPVQPWDFPKQLTAKTVEPELDFSTPPDRMCRGCGNVIEHCDCDHEDDHDDDDE